MVKHIVLFKLKDEVPEAEKLVVMNKFKEAERVRERPPSYGKLLRVSQPVKLYCFHRIHITKTVATFLLKNDRISTLTIRMHLNGTCSQNMFLC